MTVPDETVWALDPHTAAKHEILRRYLEAWFPILSSYRQQIVYIDGFCGPGRYEGGEPGSPLIALEVARSHRSALAGKLVFWFIDERQDRIDHLNRERAKLSVPSHFQVHVECMQFEQKLKELLDAASTNGQIDPTFAFIDPFGFSGIPFTLIERLLKQRRCEAFITFMVDALNRFLEHPQHKIAQHIVAAFGTEDAIEIAKTRGSRILCLRKLYQTRLEGVAEYVRFFEMRDRDNRIQYYLFFATNHELGHIKMKEAMWRVDPNGAFRFSDATNPSQLVLFESDTTSELIAAMRTYFRGKGAVTGLEIRKYVENRTAFLKKHMSMALRREEIAGGIKVARAKVDGTNRKANTYPDGAQITLL